MSDYSPPTTRKAKKYVPLMFIGSALTALGPGISLPISLVVDSEVPFCEIMLLLRETLLLKHSLSSRPLSTRFDDYIWNQVQTDEALQQGGDGAAPPSKKGRIVNPSIASSSTVSDFTHPSTLIFVRLNDQAGAPNSSAHQRIQIQGGPLPEGTSTSVEFIGHWTFYDLRCAVEEEIVAGARTSGVSSSSSDLSLYGLAPVDSYGRAGVSFPLDLTLDACAFRGSSLVLVPLATCGSVTRRPRALATGQETPEDRNSRAGGRGGQEPWSRSPWMSRSGGSAVAPGRSSALDFDEPPRKQSFTGTSSLMLNDATRTVRVVVPEVQMISATSEVSMNLLLASALKRSADPSDVNAGGASEVAVSGPAKNIVESDQPATVQQHSRYKKQSTHAVQLTPLDATTQRVSSLVNSAVNSAILGGTSIDRNISSSTSNVSSEYGSAGGNRKGSISDDDSNVLAALSAVLQQCGEVDNRRHVQEKQKSSVLTGAAAASAIFDGYDENSGTIVAPRGNGLPPKAPPPPTLEALAIAKSTSEDAEFLASLSTVLQQCGDAEQQRRMQLAEKRSLPAITSKVDVSTPDPRSQEVDSRKTQDTAPTQIYYENDTKTQLHGRAVELKPQHATTDKSPSAAAVHKKPLPSSPASASASPSQKASGPDLTQDLPHRNSERSTPSSAMYVNPRRRKDLTTPDSRVAVPLYDTMMSPVERPSAVTIDPLRGTLDKDSFVAEDFGLPKKHQRGVPSPNSSKSSRSSRSSSRSRSSRSSSLSRGTYSSDFEKDSDDDHNHRKHHDVAPTTVVNGTPETPAAVATATKRQQEDVEASAAHVSRQLAVLKETVKQYNMLRAQVLPIIAQGVRAVKSPPPQRLPPVPRPPPATAAVIAVKAAVNKKYENTYGAMLPPVKGMQSRRKKKMKQTAEVKKAPKAKSANHVASSSSPARLPSPVRLPQYLLNDLEDFQQKHYRSLTKELLKDVSGNKKEREVLEAMALLHRAKGTGAVSSPPTRKSIIPAVASPYKNGAAGRSKSEEPVRQKQSVSPLSNKLLEESYSQLQAPIRYEPNDAVVAVPHIASVKKQVAKASGQKFVEDVITGQEEGDVVIHGIPVLRKDDVAVLFNLRKRSKGEDDCQAQDDHFKRLHLTLKVRDSLHIKAGKVEKHPPSTVATISTYAPHFMSTQILSLLKHENGVDAVLEGQLSCRIAIMKDYVAECEEIQRWKGAIMQLAARVAPKSLS